MDGNETKKDVVSKPAVILALYHDCVRDNNYYTASLCEQKRKLSSSATFQPVTSHG